MLISRERQRFATIDADKVRRGAFMTRESVWLTPQVKRFILDAAPGRVIDPFAGEGHLLEALASLFPDAEHLGYDIEPRAPFSFNDSLEHVPRHDGALIVTNPPYLAKHSASRKRVRNEVNHHYVATGRNDLYQVALDRCLDAARHVVAIVPETIINARYPLDRLRSLTILEDRTFDDTDCPVCVCCFGPEPLGRSSASVYRGPTHLATLGDIERLRLTPRNDIPIRFNDPDGALALQAVDTVDPARPIAFMPRAEREYHVSGIKHSSRLVTFISSPRIDADTIRPVCERANAILKEFRANSHDVVLSPFKGNRKDGARRRRLDYRTARAILESALRSVNQPCDIATLWSDT